MCNKYVIPKPHPPIMIETHLVKLDSLTFLAGSTMSPRLILLVYNHVLELALTICLLEAGNNIYKALEV